MRSGKYGTMRWKQVIILNRVVRASLIEKVTFGERLDRSKGVNQADLGACMLPDRGNSWYKGPEAVEWLEYSRDHKEVSVSRVK